MLSHDMGRTANPAVGARLQPTPRNAIESRTEDVIRRHLSSHRLVRGPSPRYVVKSSSHPYKLIDGTDQMHSKLDLFPHAINYIVNIAL